MIIFSLLSGLINLSSQVMYQKVVSMLIGDLYTVFVAVTLVFILGASIGSYLGSYFRKYLPFIELFTGIYNLLLFITLQRTLYDLTIPLSAIIVGLFIPALALGTHIPLYSYYFRRHKFSLIFALYHLGGAIGLLSLEWHFINAGSISLSVLILGCTQTILGLGLIWFQRYHGLQVDPTPISIPIKEWKNSNLLKSNCTVFLACAISFYNVSWAVKTQLMLTETFRMQATCVTIAVFFWMTLAGSLRRIVKGQSELWFLGMACSFLFITMIFPIIIPDMNTHITGSLLQYYLISVLIAMFLTVPVLFSSLIFIQETDHLSQKWSVDVSSGILNLFAGLGSLCGLLLVYPFAQWFWDRLYFSVAIALSGLMAVILGQRKKSAFVLTIALLAAIWWLPPLKDSIAYHRTPKKMVSCIQNSDFKYFAHPQASIALHATTPKPTEECSAQFESLWYIVDGHQSHNLIPGVEIFVGAAAGMYFDAPVKKSLVIGVGSGQSAFGASTISKHVDLVEISPVVISTLEIIKEYNYDLLNRRNVNFILRDGFNHIRQCQPGNYDIILNTSTYPSSFNAAKLYSDEFVELASRCLSARGVYHTYFDSSSALSASDVYQFLAPIARHFKYIDIVLVPYPQVFAYNTPTAPKFLSDRNFLSKESQNVAMKHMKIALNLQIFPVAFSNKCIEYYPSVDLSKIKEFPVSTLDKSVLEKNSIQNIVRAINQEIPPISDALDSAFPKQKRCMNFN